MLDSSALLNKHKSKGVLLDTNLLVLYLVGRVNPNRILTYKRTQNYSVEDFLVLNELIVWLGTIATTPHILTQTSDLSALPGTELALVRSCFRTFVGQAHELFEPSATLVKEDCFERLGLADTGIALGSLEFLVLTDDLQLHLSLAKRGIDSLNFNHVRSLRWLGQ